MVEYKDAKKLACAIAIIAMLPLLVAGQTNRATGTAKTVHSFIVEDAYGHRTDIAHLNKVVFVNFWSLTCVPCKAEMPTINNLRNHYKNDTNFYVLPIDLDHNLREDMRYFNEKGFTLSIYTPAGIVPQELFMGELPTTAVIDRNGKIAFLQQGESKYDSPRFFRLIDSLLGR